MINITDKEQCCGCGSCMNICPKQCISMEQDQYGFLYPCIDSDACVNCGMCEMVCPEINTPKSHSISPFSAYIVRNKNKDILKRSTSGGFFYGICQYVCARNGVVYGVSIDEKMSIKHTRATNIDECKKFLGSKYVQSTSDYTYRSVKKDLDDGMLVCFSGTPCQVQGMFNYLQRKSYENLILVDIVCHGVVSASLWKEYLEYEKDKNQNPVSDVEFRSKRYGYQNSTMRIRVGSKDIYGTSRTNPYLKCFYSNIALRDSCYNCSAKSVNRVSDFTIYDSWNAHTVIKKEDDDKGYTNVIVQSLKGQTIIDQLTPYLAIYHVELDKILPKNGGMILNSSAMNAHRQDFLEEVGTQGFETAFNHYLCVHKKDYVVEKLKFIISGVKAFRKLSKLKREVTRKL